MTLPQVSRAVFLAEAVLFSAAIPAGAVPSDDCRMLAREQRANILLAGMLGPEQARLILSVERPRTAAVHEALWDRILRRAAQAPVVLPGYRVPRSLAEEALRAWEEANPPVVSARLMVDPGVDERLLQDALKSLRAALGDASLGEIEIERVKMSRPRKDTPLGADFWKAAATIAASALLGLPLLLALALLRPVPGAPDANRPELAWIGRRHARTIADFLGGESPLAAARILGALSPALAADVYRLLPEGLQRLAARALLDPPARPALLAKTRRRPELRLRLHVRKRQTGIGLVEELLLRSPQWTRESVLAYLDSTAPGAAALLRASLISLFNLASADPCSLRLCLSPYSSEQLALSLYDLPKPLADSLLRPLPETIRKLVEERRKFLVPGSLDQVERARADIVVRWKQLEATGRVPAITAEAGA